MRKTFIFFGGLVFLVSVFAIVPQAKAITSAEIQILIQQLQQRIAQLQQQLTAIQGTTQAWCYDFNINLRIGDSGAGITALQTALEKEGLLDNITNEFDEETASAVVGLQEKYKSEILSPLGLKRGTGFVGKSTRAKLNKLYGCGLITVMPPTLVTPPTTTLPPVTATAPSITVLSPNGGELFGDNLIYNITWKYGGNIYPQVDILLQIFRTDGYKFSDRLIAAGVNASQMSYGWNPKQIVSAIDFPEGAAKYKIFIREGNDSATAVTDASDNYFSIVSPSITVLSPNGGEVWSKNSAQTIRWNTTGVLNNVSIDVYIPREDGTWNWQPLAVNIGNFNSYVWNLSSDGRLLNSEIYKIRVSGINAIGQTVQDESDGRFSIVSPTVSVPSLIVLSPNGGELFGDNSIYNITWKYGGNIYPQVDILLQIFRTDGYKFSDRLIAAGVNASQMSYGWNPKQIVSAINFPEGAAKYKIFIREGNDSAVAVTDVSDNYFSIVSATIPSLTVLSPNGGETISDSSIYNITWKYGGNVYSQIDILLQIFRADGIKFSDRLIAAGVSTGSMSYGWNPKQMVSAIDFPEGAAKYKIFIREANDSAAAIFDTSNSYFSIVSPEFALNDVESRLASISAGVSNLMAEVNKLLGR